MKLKNKGKIYPSSSSSISFDYVPDGDFLSVLNLLPAAILALASVLSLEDREVLAYLITRSLKSSTTPESKKKSSKRTMGGGFGSAHNPPIFDCDCFDCYRTYWFRWDSSVNRELIHQAIEAFEDQLTNGEKSKKSSGRSKRRDRTVRRDPEKPASIQNQNNGEIDESYVIPTPSPISVENAKGSERGDADEKEEVVAKPAGELVEELPEEEEDRNVSGIVQTSSPSNNKGNSARKMNQKRRGLIMRLYSAARPWELPPSAAIRAASSTFQSRGLMQKASSGKKGVDGLQESSGLCGLGSDENVDAMAESYISCVRERFRVERGELEHRVY